MKLLRLIIILLMCWVSFVTLAFANAIYEIPIQMINGLPTIDVIVNGKKINLVVDFGGRNTISLNRQVVNQPLEAPIYTGVVKKNIDAAGNLYDVDEVVFQHIDLNGLTLSYVVGTTFSQHWGLYLSEDNENYSHEFTREQENTNGIIGIDLLANHSVLLDYKENKIILCDKNLPQKYSNLTWKQGLLKLDNQGIIFDGKINGVNGSFLIDTAATVSFIRKIFLDKKLNTNTQSKVTQHDILLNNNDLINVSFYIYDFEEPEVDGIIGHDFLMKHLVYLDFHNNQIYIHEQSF